jgi:hypothetical protein
MEKLIRNLFKRDFKQLGLQDSFDITTIRNQLLDSITSEDEQQIVNILNLQRHLTELGYIITTNNNDDIKLFIRHSTKTPVISAEEFELKESVVPITSYDKWLFDNLQVTEVPLPTGKTLTQTLNLQKKEASLGSVMHD